MWFSTRIVLIFALVLLSCSEQTSGHRSHSRKILGLPGLSSSAVSDLVDLTASPLEGLQPGMTNDAVRVLKQQLASLGFYLVKDAVPGLNVSSLSDYFDETLHAAVTRFQQFNKLNITGGVVDKATLAALLKDRCAFPDIVNNNFWDGNVPNLNLVEYSVLGGNGDAAPGPAASRRLLFTRTQGNVRWNKVNLTYAFDALNTTSDISTSEVKVAIRQALNTWQAVANLTFREVSDVSAADIKFRFRIGAHGDGSAFQSGTLAHAFSPLSGELHVNDEYLWSADASSAPKNSPQFDLMSVVLHELGHIFGLGHSSDETAIMYASLANNINKRVLAQDDINGIKSIYGGNPNGTLAPQSGGGTDNPECMCAAGFKGWSSHKQGSVGCRRYCYCDSGSGSSYTCYNALRLAADFWCYPDYYFTTICTDDGTSGSSPQIASTLIVDPTTTVIPSRRAPVRDAVAQVADAPPDFNADGGVPPSARGSALPSRDRQHGLSVAVLSAVSATAMLLGLAVV